MSVRDFTSQPPLLVQQPAQREKTKRPQLSCNPCRARKVKCDRIQPCTACSLHQIAEICRYDLSETERQPILQAEALKEKDKAIAKLRNELAILRGEEVKSESVDGTGSQKIKLPPRSPKKQANQSQRHFHQGDVDDSVYFPNPGVTTVADEFANLSFDRRSMSIPNGMSRGSETSVFHLTSHPFPTLWSAQDDTSTIIKLLPPEQDLFFYLEEFQRRAQSCSFPFVPEECTTSEVRRFMESLEHNAALHPDMLALLFATLAQGLQDGVYDKNEGKWVAGTVEQESKKGDVYIAASMQCLRLSSFMNRPTLLAIETLLMMGPYLTNSGKFLDASALFGISVRLAQCIGLHRDPSQMSPPLSLKEAEMRKIIWWWMLHTDQQYSMALSRPLAISCVGDCPPPEPILPDPIAQSLFTYIAQFTLLSRQTVAAGYLGNDKIDKYTDDLLTLQRTIPLGLQLDVTWLNQNKPLAGWPLDVQAGILHATTHNLLIILNRGRSERLRRNSEGAQISLAPITAPTDITGVVRGRPRVLESCRALLLAFEFFHTRLRAAMIHWTMGQMAFNASMILTLSMLETGETQDLRPVQHAYSTFLEMNKLGIHKLAGAAVERLGTLMKEFRSEDSANESVMGQPGMILLELPGFKGSGSDSWTTLGLQMPNTEVAMGRAATHLGHRTESSHVQRKRGQRRAALREGKAPKGSKKAPSKPPRSIPDRRFSDSSTPRPSNRRRTNRSTPNLSLLTSVPGQSMFSATSTPAVKSETLFTPSQSVFDNVSHSVRSPAFQAELRLNLDHMTRSHSHGFPHSQHATHAEHHNGLHLHHHPAPVSDPNDSVYSFSTQTTPYSTEFFDSSLPSGGHPFDDHHHISYEHPPFSSAPYSVPNDGSGFAASHF